MERSDVRRDHPGPPAAGIRAHEKAVRRGGGAGGGGADRPGVPRAVAAHGDRRLRMGRPRYAGST